MNARRRLLLAALIAVAVAWTVREVPGFGALPLIDDDTNIFLNPHMGAPDASRLAWMFGDLHAVHRYLPLGWLGFSCVYSFSGLDPAGYHIADAAFHLANAILLFLALERLLGRFAADEPEERRSLAAGAAALLWAVHPLRVETTAWCSGLLYSQAGFFALLAVLARLSELEARRAGEPGRARRALGLGVLAYAASVLTYPVALSLPLALAVVDLAWMGRRSADSRSDPGGQRRALAAGFAAYGLVAVAGIAINLVAEFVRAPLPAASTAPAGFGAVGRVLHAAYLAAVHIWWCLWPGSRQWAQGTVFEVDPGRAIWWLAVATVLGISWAAWSLRRRAPFLGACWIAYLLLLAPNLGLMGHPHTAADRYGYVPGEALAAALGFALLRIPGRSWRLAAAGACAVAAVACARTSVAEARNWRDSATWMRTLAGRTDDADLRAILVARQAKLRFLSGEVREGREDALRELGTAPDNGGVALVWREIAPAAPLAPDVAARSLQEWPAAPWACLHKQVAAEELANGGIDAALDHLDAAVALAPGYSEARLRRGLLLASIGRPSEGLHDWFALERIGDRSPPIAAGSRLLTAQLAAAYRAQGEGGLADGLFTARSIRADHSLSVPAVAPATSAALSR